MIEKNRGENVILEIVEALKSKGFEFPRAHKFFRRCILKKTVLVLRAGLQETFLDKKIIVLLLIVGFIIDNGVRRMVNNALQAGQPLGIFEGFIMCVNHWYYLIIFLVGFIFVLAGVPRLDSEQIFLIYRIGKKSWFFGEILQVSFCAVIYILLLFISSIASCAKYCYIGNVWSNFTVYYKSEYEALLSDNNRFIDQQVFKYYSPYQSVLHCIFLLALCLALMGTVNLYFVIINKKLVGILLNIIFILFVLIFSNYRAGVMWLSPFCHAVLALHNIYVYKELSVPLYYSYLYLIILEGIVIFFSLKQLKNKMFY